MEFLLALANRIEICEELLTNLDRALYSLLIDSGLDPDLVDLNKIDSLIDTVDKQWTHYDMLTTLINQRKWTINTLNVLKGH